MTRHTPPIATIALLSVALGSILAGPHENVLAAAADIQKVPPEQRHFIRYLDKEVIPFKDQRVLNPALYFQLNSLSSYVEPVLPAVINGTLFRIDIRDYGWKREVWEKLARQDPYYHVLLDKDGGIIYGTVPQIKVQVPVVPAVAVPQAVAVPAANAEEIVLVEIGGDRLREVKRSEVKPGDVVYRRERGSLVKEGVFKGAAPAVGPVPQGESGAGKQQGIVPDPDKDAVSVAHAPWLPKEAILALALATNSDVPIVRADWFMWQTGVQLDRGGAGYYDFLNLKNRKDVEALVALRIEDIRRLRFEWAAIIKKSGVAINSRAVLRQKTLTGGFWFTLDVKNTRGRRNPLRVLNGDLVHDAEEIYGVLPNGLYVTVASDDKGVLQDVVPQAIALGQDSGGNDKNIHPFMSCVICHREGLQPIDDYARKVFKLPSDPAEARIALASPIYEKSKRLQQLYLSDLPGELEADKAVYARALLRVNGLTPKANSEGYEQAWNNYLNRELTLEDTARELHVEPKVWREALVKYSTSTGADTILVGLIAAKPEGVRREHWHESVALAYAILAGTVGGKKP